MAVGKEKPGKGKGRCGVSPLSEAETLDVSESTPEVFEDFHPCPKEDWFAEKLLAKYAR